MTAARPTLVAGLAPVQWMVGSWRGEGTMFGRPSHASLEVAPALDSRFVELAYRAGGFEGRAFYRPLAGEAWRGEWFDNRGAHFGIGARAATARSRSSTP